MESRLFSQSMMTKKIQSLCFCSLLISGCSIFSGSYLSTSSSQLVNDSDAGHELSSLVDVYLVTPSLIAQLNAAIPVVKSRNNLHLDEAINQYKYHIGAGDVLNVTVWDHPELTIPAGSFRNSVESGNWVHADGTIFYPHIGQVKVAGMTVMQVRDMIAHKLAKFIESPQVEVNVAAFRSQQSYITGEIKQPGPQAISNIPLTLLDAVNRSGGITENADWHHVTLTRNGIEHNVSLYALIQKGDLTQNHLLVDGDIIHVPVNDKQKVFVMGEVREPQTLKIDRNGMSLTEALSNVGGLDQLNADATGIFVIRNRHLDDKTTKNEPETWPKKTEQYQISPASKVNNPPTKLISQSDELCDTPMDEEVSSLLLPKEQKNQKPQIIADIYQIDMKNATSLVLGTEFELKAYDVVYVTAAPISRWNRLIRQLLPTISGFNELSEGVLRIRNW